jgi:hypothetical protein
MATHNRNLAMVVAQPSRRSGTAGPQKMIRLAVPMLYAAMGVSLGTLAGVATAFVSVPTASAAAVDSNSSDAPVQMAALATPTPTPAPAPVTAPAPATTPATNPATAPASASNAGSSEAAQPASVEPVAVDPQVHRAIKVEEAPAAEPAPARTPSVDKTAAPETDPAETRPAKHLAHPVTRPLRTEVAADPEVQPEQIDMEIDQPTPVDEAKSSTFYSEGDITVVSYDATQGTIETADGRTFELGETVTTGNTVAWDQYRANVHYRCEQGGSCVLQREGAVTVNSRQI